MRLLTAGDFRIGRSSGYAVILENLCTQLAQRGHEVTLLGDTWQREEHNYPFQVIPSDYYWTPMQALRVHQALRFDNLLLAMDVPKVEQLWTEMGNKDMIKDLPPISALFPIESTPIVAGWLRCLQELNKLFVISHFGQQELAAENVDAVYAPVTANLPEKKLEDRDWFLQYFEKYIIYGDAKRLNGKKLVLTVADNQERKALPVIAEAMQELPDCTWILVTPMQSPYGWTLPQLFDYLFINDKVVVTQNLPKEVLTQLYQAADCFVIASQAEGACLPLYEAMACGTTCVAPDHTAIHEALADGRGYLVKPKWRTIHPFGNTVRYHVSATDMVSAIEEAVWHPREGLQEWIENRTWADLAEVVERELCDG